MYWSWILTLIGGTAFFLAGKKIWWCWYINVACQVLWFIYGWASHQYGFIASAIFFAVVFTRNALDWTKDHRDPDRGFDFNETAMPTFDMEFKINDSEVNSDGVRVIKDATLHSIEFVNKPVEKKED